MPLIVTYTTVKLVYIPDTSSCSALPFTSTTHVSTHTFPHPHRHQAQHTSHLLEFQGALGVMSLLTRLRLGVALVQPHVGPLFLLCRAALSVRRRGRLGLLVGLGVRGSAGGSRRAARRRRALRLRLLSCTGRGGQQAGGGGGSPRAGERVRRTACSAAYSDTVAVVQHRMRPQSCRDSFHRTQAGCHERVFFGSQNTAKP